MTGWAFARVRHPEPEYAPKAADDIDNIAAGRRGQKSTHKKSAAE
jgi:hypothetical protein